MIQCPEMAGNSLLQTAQTPPAVGQSASYQTTPCFVSAVRAIGVSGLGIFRSVIPQFRTRLRSYEQGQVSGFDYRLGREFCLSIKKSCPVLKPVQISIRFDTGAFRTGVWGSGYAAVGETDT